MRTDDGRRGKNADRADRMEVMIRQLQNDYVPDTITHFNDTKNLNWSEYNSWFLRFRSI